MAEEKKKEEKKKKKASEPRPEKIWVQPEGQKHFQIIYQDVFHFKSLYFLMYEWLFENGWVAHQGKWEEDGKYDEYKYPETLFYDNRSQGNKKMWIWWRLQKPTESSFYHYYMTINFMMLGLTEAEAVNRSGTKFKGQLGELTINIKPWIEIDYKTGWQRDPFLRMFYNLFRKRVLNEELLQREDLLLRESYRFIGSIKKFLEQHTFIPETEVLYEPRRKYV